jgi:TIR domain
MDGVVKRSVSYFVSYTRDDGQLPGRLLQRLGYQLQASRDFQFSPWRDTSIFPGEDWDAQIRRGLGEADFGLLLVSPAFLRNPYIIEHELGPFVSQSKPCIPVTLREIDFERHDLRGLKPLQFFGFTPPKDSRPRSFERCTSAVHQSEFAQELFKSIVDRLDKYYKTSAA